MKKEFQNFSSQYIDDIKSEKESNYFTPVWNEIINDVAFETLLDVGCGNGVFSANLKTLINCKLIGIDGSEHALLESKKNGYDETYLVQDFCEDTLPFNSDSFNMIVCKDVLEHLIHPDKLINEI